MRYASKEALIRSIEEEHEAFVSLAASIPKTRYKEPGVWGDGWTVHDLFAHLTEWEQMFLRWHREGARGAKPEMPAPGYKWNQTPELNRAIWRKHEKKSTRRVLDEFDASYDEIFSLARSLTSEELLEPGAFPWTGRYPLTTYLGANPCSHYRVAAKILKRWLKGERRPAPGGSGKRSGRS